jgi:hypothetical protein
MEVLFFRDCVMLTSASLYVGRREKLQLGVVVLDSTGPG